ncbi:hypothetical protein [Rubinisphaera sp. JC750]|uniref:hypothetical protein n=1 Tax=Rubinisphaera sp. JC750 TaxID=2898658 RepID=UPI001F44BF9C|nr:hypothetical protein [Rubinisphaera sp. JC750]
MTAIPVIVRSGLSGGETPIGSVRLLPHEIGIASAMFSSTYILHMGMHYERYVVSGYLPQFNAVQSIYSTAIPAANATTKTRAQSVTGNIGESIAALVARRKLNARRLADIQPLSVSSKKKTPDFRMKFRPMFPWSFQNATGINPPITFDFWPVESKAAQSDSVALNSVKSALLQLGTYWYERSYHEPDVVGFGIVVSFIYRGTKNDPKRCIRVHVFCPSNQTALQNEIADRIAASDDRTGFLTELGTENSAIRGYLRDVD